MAKTRDIRTRVAFEGETEYKKVVSDIAAEHKKLNNELKAAQAEFKATGNAEKMFEEKSKLLNKQIEAQNKAIKTAEDALKKLKDNGVEKSSAAWVYWEKELTSAKTAMFNATAELNKLNSEFGNVTTATERATQETADYSETLKSIDKGVKFSNILQGLRTVKDTVGSVISTAWNMAKALAMTQLSGGDWAREIMMEATRAGLSVEEYQARQYAELVGGIPTSAIDEGIKKTTENIASTDAELLKLYAMYGIETRKATGAARDATEVFWDSVDALKNIEDQTQRSIIAQKLLGDQYMELRGLVSLGSEGYEKLIEEGKKNAVVSEENVQALTDMDAAVSKAESAASRIAHNVESELAPGFTAVAEAIAKTLSEFDEFLQTEEGKKVFDNWNKSLSDLAGTIEDIDFKTALDGIAATVNVIAAAMKVIGEAWSMIRQDFTQFSIITSPETRAKVKERAKEESLFETLTKQPSLLGWEETTDGNGAGNAVGSSAAANVLESASGWSGIMQEANGFYVDLIKSAMQEAESTASEGGEKAIEAFNTAVEQEGEKTSKVMKSLVSDAFSGFDSLFASMGNAHGQAYVNALYAQMARVNTMLSLSPSYAFGGSLFTPSAVTPGALARQNANVNLYVGREKVAEVFTPIIDGQMGADIQTMR